MSFLFKLKFNAVDMLTATLFPIVYVVFGILPATGLFFVMQLVSTISKKGLSS